MNNKEYIVRDARTSEFLEVGKLMVEVYSHLEGFPPPDEMPKYYEMLLNIGNLTTDPGTRLLVADTADGNIAGGVIFIGDMKYYRSGGTATSEKNASGFRLLAVDPSIRGKGIGRLLTDACIKLAKDDNQSQMIIHSTKAMRIAWKMYERLGFKRSEDLDFMQGELEVFGFRLSLQ